MKKSKKKFIKKNKNKSKDPKNNYKKKKGNRKIVKKATKKKKKSKEKKNIHKFNKGRSNIKKLKNVFFNISFIEKIAKSKLVSDLGQKTNRFKTWRQNNKKYKMLSRVTLVILFMLSLYLIIYPFLPAIIFKLRYEDKEFFPYQTNLEGKASHIEYGDEGIPQDNRLVIPSINVNMAIVEGGDENSLDIGVWHRPGTGTPGNGNMVLTGHRVGYAFLPEDVRTSTSFYNLDKLEVDDYVIVYWEGKEFDYEIYDWEVVEPTANHIENQDVGERLTLYTCHPLGQLTHRLVYYAKPIENIE